MNKDRKGAERAGLAKAAFLLAAFLFCGAQAFAEIGMHVKGTLGYGFSLYEYRTGLGGSWLKAKPAFGISPWAGHRSAFLEDLSL